MELRDIAAGKRFHQAARPLGVGRELPFRIAFEHVDVVDVRGVGRHQVPVHQHAHYEIIVILDGAYDCRINGIAVSLTKGGIAVLKPGDLHEDIDSREMRFAAVEIRVLPGPSPDRSASLFAVDMPVGAQVMRAPEGAFGEVALRLVDEAQRIDAFTSHMLDAIAAEFMWMLVRSMPRAAIDPALLAGGDEHEFASRLTRLFDERLEGQLGLREMARALGMSERTLTARCRAAFATSPTRLFVGHQMARARALLIHTDLPVKDISAHLGYENPYHFSKVYKRIFGVAPTQARKADDQ